MCQSESSAFTRLLLPILGDIAETEVALRQFYRSGEAETTTNRFFPSFNCTLCLQESRNSGVGLFLEERAVPGQLLILGQAISSCKCTHQSTLDETDSYGLAPNADSLLLSTRIPPTVKQHLAYHLARKLTTCDTSTQAQINMLDATHQCLQQPGETLDNHEISQRRLSKAVAEMNLKDSEADKLHVLDLEELKNIVSNNAMCDKGRFLNLNGSASQVETCEQWGVWVIPSWINHSCSPNCHRMRIGDAMIIRAAKPIADGEELTLPYFDIFQPLHSRETNCREYLFRCECPRCTFERSIGERYEIVQKMIGQIYGNLMHSERRTDHVKDRLTRAKGLLKQLMDLAKPVDILIHELAIECELKGLLIMKNPDEQNFSGRSPDDVLPMSYPRSTSQVVSADVMQSWIQASFIEVQIAAYALCEAGYFNSRESSYPFGRLVHWRETPTCETKELTGELTFSLRIVAAINRILPIVEELHPGNMLGEELHSILLSEFRKFVYADVSKNRADNTCYLRMLDTKAVLFCGNYYGYAGSAILRSCDPVGSNSESMDFHCKLLEAVDYVNLKYS